MYLRNTCWNILSLVAVVCIATIHCDLDPNAPPLDEVCVLVTQEFAAHLNNVQNSNLGGGNTDWERSRIGNYMTSETRFMDIFEKLCKKSASYEKTMCHMFVEEHEQDLEDWYFQSYTKDLSTDSLFNDLCVQKLKLGCPLLKYGPNCTDCPYLITDRTVNNEFKHLAACSGTGKCAGNMTRSGTGKCECDRNYEGEGCQLCAATHYKVVMEEFPFFACHQCNPACESNGCVGAPSLCRNCSAGYTKLKNEQAHTLSNGTRVDTYTCTDIDECASESGGGSVCPAGKYCRNEAGTYTCEKCHPACAENCTGYRPEDCVGKCNRGFETQAAKREREGGAAGTNVSTGCYDVNECVVGDANSSLSAHELCSAKPRTYCRNTRGSYACVPCNEACLAGCRNGSEPKHCTGSRCARGFVVSADGSGACEDINECGTGQAKCGKDRLCVNTPGGYTCHCTKEYCDTESEQGVDKTTEATDRCELCLQLAMKFSEGLVNTSRANFGGGNTDWESGQLGDYLVSETRLLTITERLCKREDFPCQLFYERHEADIEHWWRHTYTPSLSTKTKNNANTNSTTDPFRDLCVTKWQACCPALKYGPDCSPCKHMWPVVESDPSMYRAGAQNALQAACSGRGHCIGNYTRAGNGECVCQEGYAGSDCSMCGSGYWLEPLTPKPTIKSTKAHKQEEEQEKDEEPLVGAKFPYFRCLKCDPACHPEYSCVGGTNADCYRACRTPGYRAVATTKRTIDEDVATGKLLAHLHAVGPLDTGRKWLRPAIVQPVTCVDIDECAEAAAAALNASATTTKPLLLCGRDQHCVNRPGTYECVACDEACGEAGCTGPGPAACVGTCARGFQRSPGGMDACEDVDECALQRHSRELNDVLSASGMNDAAGIADESGSVACNGANEQCVNVPGSFRCECTAGFERNAQGVCSKFTHKKDEL